MPLPYGLHTVEEDDVALVCEALRSDFLTGGPFVERFERAFAGAVEADHAVVCANGTAALHLAALCLNLGEDDVAIVPTVTFLASANAFRLVGAQIVFADVDPETGLMTPDTLDDALRSAPARRRRVVVPVHLGGKCWPPDEIASVARRHHAEIVEDACHAIGTRYRASDGREHAVGACAASDMTVFSLHPVKTIAMGEGGVITTRDADRAERLRRLRNHGMSREPATFENRNLGTDRTGEPNPWYYEMMELGLNYRASDIHCALGLSQLGKLQRFSARRRHLAARYDRLLADLAPAVVPNPAVAGCTPVLHLYAVHIDFDSLGIERAAVMNRLRDAGVGTQVHYIPVHLQPYYRRQAPTLSLPGAEAYYRSTLTLPLFPSMRDDDVDRVVATLAGAIGVTGRGSPP